MGSNIGYGALNLILPAASMLGDTVATVTEVLLLLFQELMHRLWLNHAVQTS